MNICLVSHSFYPATSYGGPIFSTYELSKRLAELGFNIYVSTTNANGSNSLSIETDRFIEVHKRLFVRYYFEQITYFFSFSFVFGLWNDIKKSDLVYLQYIFHYTVPLALFYSFLLNKKLVICPRASLSSWGIRWKGRISSLLKRIWLYLFIRPFAYNIKWQGCSSIEIKDIHSFFPNADCYDLPDGIDVNAFDFKKTMTPIDVVKKYTGKEFDTVSDIIFSMGRLHKIKGFDLLIKSFSSVLLHKPNAKLLIAGSGDDYEVFLKKEIARLDLVDSVFLIGQLNNIEKKEMLAHASLFALCSHVESFGIVVLEALASGTPVIVSDKTIWSELEKYKCGIFVSNKPDLFATALVAGLNINYISEDCIKYVNSRYNIDIIADSFVKFFCKN